MVYSYQPPPPPDIPAPRPTQELNNNNPNTRELFKNTQTRISKENTSANLVEKLRGLLETFREMMGVEMFFCRDSVESESCIACFDVCSLKRNRSAREASGNKPGFLSAENSGGFPATGPY